MGTIESPKRKQEYDSVFLGLLLVWVCNGLQLYAAGSMPTVGTETVTGVLVFGLPLVQLLYVIPLAVWAKRSSRPRLMAGIIIGASITFLLSASCYGFFWYLGSHMK